MIKRETRPRVILGIVVLLVSILAVIWVAAPMQEKWGMWGLAFTEFLLLGVAFGFFFLFKWDFKSVFAMRIPSLRQVLGVLVLWLASYIVVNAISVVLFYFFPTGMSEVGTSLTGFFTSIPLPLALIVVAVLPGICEEVLHRGVIQYTFKGKSKWLTILSMAVIFGFFHIDIYRFLPTAFLGGVLTYIMLETDNLLLPMLLHTVNNAVTTLLAFSIGSVEQSNLVSLNSVGSALIVCAFAPFLFEVGRRLLARKEEKFRSRAKKRTWPIALLLTIVLVMTGALIIKSNIPVFQTSFSQQVTVEDRGHQQAFTVEKAGKYRLDLSMQGAEPLITSFYITNVQQEEIYFASANSVTVEAELELEVGDYLVAVDYDLQGLEPVPLEVSVLISKRSIFASPNR